MFIVLEEPTSSPDSKNQFQIDTTQQNSKYSNNSKNSIELENINRKNSHHESNLNSKPSSSSSSSLSSNKIKETDYKRSNKHEHRHKSSSNSKNSSNKDDENVLKNTQIRHKDKHSSQSSSNDEKRNSHYSDQTEKLNNFSPTNDKSSFLMCNSDKLKDEFNRSNEDSHNDSSKYNETKKRKNNEDEINKNNLYTKHDESNLTNSHDSKRHKKKHSKHDEDHRSREKHSKNDKHTTSGDDKHQFKEKYRGKDNHKEKHKHHSKEKRLNNEKQTKTDDNNLIEENKLERKKESSHSSKVKVEKINENDEKNDRKRKLKTDEKEEGFDHTDGLGFAEALGMLEIPTTKSDKKRKVTASVSSVSSSSVKDVPSKKSISIEKKSITSTSSSVVSKTPPLLAPTIKLKPLDPVISLELPTISPHYKPLPLNPTVMECVFANSNKPPKKQMTDEEAFGVSISSKTIRTKVFSGNKSSHAVVPTLYEMCIRILQKYFDALEHTGGVPYEILKPVLERTTPEQLEHFEMYNDYIMEDTDELWKNHCDRKFRGKHPQEYESWREMYFVCVHYSLKIINFLLILTFFFFLNRDVKKNRKLD